MNDILINKIKNLYNENKFNEALTLCKNIKLKTNEVEKWMALCYQGLGKDDLAIKIYRKLAFNGDSFGCMELLRIYDKNKNIEEFNRFKKLLKKINKERQEKDFLETIFISENKKYINSVVVDGYEEDGLYHINKITSDEKIVIIEFEKPALLENDIAFSNSTFYAVINVEEIKTSALINSFILGIALGPKVNTIQNNDLIIAANYFYVTKNNKYFYADETGLYTKNMKTLIKATINNETYRVNDKVKEISYYAFFGNNTLKNICIKKNQCHISLFNKNINIIEE